MFWHVLTGSCSNLFGYPMNFQWARLIAAGLPFLSNTLRTSGAPELPSWCKLQCLSLYVRSEACIQSETVRAQRPSCFASQAKPPVKYLWGPYSRYFPAGLGRSRMSISRIVWSFCCDHLGIHILGVNNIIIFGARTSNSKAPAYHRSGSSSRCSGWCWWLRNGHAHIDADPRPDGESRHPLAVDIFWQICWHQSLFGHIFFLRPPSHAETWLAKQLLGVSFGMFLLPGGPQVSMPMPCSTTCWKSIKKHVAWKPYTHMQNDAE